MKIDELLIGPIDGLRAFLRRNSAVRRPLMPILRYFSRFLNMQPADNSAADHRRWVAAFDTLDDSDRARIRSQINMLAACPVISVVMPVYNTPESYLRAAINSVRAQIYPHWQLCIADDASPSSHVVTMLEQAAATDDRIRWVRRDANGHISAATNTALTLASGEWVALMDHDDILPEHALYELALEMMAHPDAQVIYSDEDRIDDNGLRSHPYFKPDFDPDLLLGQNVFNHLGAYRRELLQRLGGLRIGFEGSQDHDLALRASALVEPDQIRHIAKILYHWRKTSSSVSFSDSDIASCAEASRRAVREHLAGRGVPAEVAPAPLAPNYNRVIWPVPEPAPLVSVIIPTRDRIELLATCVDGLLHRTNYPAIEVLIVDNDSSSPDALAYFARIQTDPRVRVIAAAGPFNYSELNNRAATQARGEILLLLNNDIKVIEGDWLRELVSHAMRHDIGAVGAKLLYADGRLQHGGIVLGIGGVAGHYRVGERRNSAGPFGWLALTRTTSALTGACLAVRRAIYNEVCGLDAQDLPVAFGDVDLCLRIQEHGYRNIWTPAAELYHLESASRGLDSKGKNAERFRRETAVMLRRWDGILQFDPCWNPNLSLDSTHGVPAWPPRQQQSSKRASQLLSAQSTSVTT
jgi:GT2 family glycosyltransferase